jgi:protein gp37
MSNIEWTDMTANPIHIVREDGSNGGHFCNKISPGCLHCFSETQNQSNYFAFASHLLYAGKAPENLIFDEAVMEKFIRMRSPKKVFLCSMTDLFGEWVPDEWLDKAFAYMAFSSQHTFQVLTKRTKRMQRYLSDPVTPDRIEEMGYSFTHNMDCVNNWPLPNVWLGTSIENQQAADDRIPMLLDTPAVLHFVSAEPLLEKIDLSEFLICAEGRFWVICGGESGSGARPCHIDWIRSLVQQCQQTKTAVFVKQWGSQAIDSSPYIDGVVKNHFQVKLKNRKGGDITELPLDVQIREFPLFLGK